MNWLRTAVCLGALAAPGFPLAGQVAEAAAPFALAPAGCPMVHCDPSMSDQVKLMPPLGPNPAVIAHDTLPTGTQNPFTGPSAPTGNGCSANGEIAVCSYSNAFGDNIVAYNHAGARLWTSGNLINLTSWASVPIISADGDVIAADNKSLIRFGPTGDVVWNTATPGGIPISPVPTPAGEIVLATFRGPISLFDSTDGGLIGSLFVRPESDPTQFFDTINTPCLANDRLYVSMSLPNDPNDTARLVAIDVDPDNPNEPLKVAWHVPFGAPSGASPLCVGNMIYFDGGRRTPGGPEVPHLFAVRDDGAAGTVVWARAVAKPVPASFALDPRGGFWVEFTGSRYLQRRSLQTGAIVEFMDILGLVGGANPNFPWSVLNIAGTPTQPILTLGTIGIGGQTSWVMAVDMQTRAALWKVNLTPSQGIDNASVQFPIVLDPSGNPVLVFAGRTSGAYFVKDQ